MWQAPDLKRRAKIEAQNRLKERAKRKNRMQFRSTRVQVKLPSAPGTKRLASARVILQEMDLTEMRCFVDRLLPVGELVEFILSDPRLFYVRGQVVACQDFNSESRVISTDPLPYRVKVLFVFESENEKDEFHAFCEELAAAG